MEFPAKLSFLMSEVFSKKLEKSGNVEETVPANNMEENQLPATISFAELYEKLIKQFSPSSILINEKQEIAYISPQAVRFCQLEKRPASQKILKIINSALKIDLKKLLLAAKQRNRKSSSRGIGFEINGEKLLVKLSVQVLTSIKHEIIFYQIIFEDVANLALPFNKDQKNPEYNRAERLEHELKRTQDQLRRTISQNEASIKILKDSNEELLVINKKLQSAADELKLPA